MEFIYGWDPHSKTFEIMTEGGVEFLNAVRQCRTWGEWADLCGLSWPRLVEDYELEGLSEESPFRITEEVGRDWVAARPPDARTDPYDVLIQNLPPEVRHDPRLKGKIEWIHGSPAGHLECVTAVDEDGIRLLERLVHEAGRKEYAFRRDDAVIHDVLYGGGRGVPHPWLHDLGRSPI
jgi:hypothetical protein